ncbi:hypothetical protein [Actinoallomurus sp. CA-142502]|uniref:hypothetical protein n=1 Tax=Actinoallomurus sp. CA-142502 TaxID=3239885 RepID=UPI003D9253ED
MAEDPRGMASINNGQPIVFAEPEPTAPGTTTTPSARETLIAALLDAWKLPQATRSRITREAAGRDVDAILAALAADQGDLCERMAEALKRFFDDPPTDDGPEESLRAAGRAVLAVRDERVAHLTARLTQAEARWELERQRANAAERKCEMAEQAAQRWHDEYGRILAERDDLRAHLTGVAIHAHRLKAHTAGGTSARAVLVDLLAAMGALHAPDAGRPICKCPPGCGCGHTSSLESPEGGSRP